VNSLVSVDGIKYMVTSQELVGNLEAFMI